MQGRRVWMRRLPLQLVRKWLGVPQSFLPVTFKQWCHLLRRRSDMEASVGLLASVDATSEG